MSKPAVTKKDAPAPRKPNGKAEPPPDGLTVLRDKHKDRWVAEERRYLARVLRAEDWNLNETARAIGCAVSSLQRALARHPDLDAERQAWAREHGWLRRRAERAHERKSAA